MPIKLLSFLIRIFDLNMCIKIVTLFIQVIYFKNIFNQTFFFDYKYLKFNFLFASVLVALTKNFLKVMHIFIYFLVVILIILQLNLFVMYFKLQLIFFLIKKNFFNFFNFSLLNLNLYAYLYLYLFLGIIYFLMLFILKF